MCVYVEITQETFFSLDQPPLQNEKWKLTRYYGMWKQFENSINEKYVRTRVKKRERDLKWKENIQ